MLTRLYLRAENAIPDMPMIWIFPYFFEPRILECLPSLTMLDYQVNQILPVLYQEETRSSVHVSPPADENIRYVSMTGTLGGDMHVYGPLSS